MPRKPGESSSIVKKQKFTKIYNAARPVRHSFYDTSQWKRIREWFRDLYPLCQVCEENGIVRESQVVDHIVPIESGGAMADGSNLQALCFTCHNRKHFAMSDKTQGRAV